MQELKPNLIINSLSKMILKNERELDRFAGRIIKAQLIEKPKLRLLRAANAMVNWYSEEIERLKIELESIFSAMPLRLRVLEESDLRRICHWVNRHERKTFQVKIWEKNLRRWKTDPNYSPISVDLESDQGKIHIGFILIEIGKTDSDSESPEGKIDFLIIDDKYRGFGYGARAVKMAVEYAFKDLDLFKMNLWVSAENMPAMRCFEKAGFKAVSLEWDDELRGEKFRMELLRRAGKNNHPFFQD